MRHAVAFVFHEIQNESGRKTFKGALSYARKLWVAFLTDRIGSDMTNVAWTPRNTLSSLHFFALQKRRRNFDVSTAVLQSVYPTDIDNSMVIHRVI